MTIIPFEDIMQGAYDENNESWKIINTGQLVSEEYDYIALTYVSSGNGAGEIETVTYKNGGSSGTTVATLTLTYDSSDRIIAVERT